MTKEIHELKRCDHSTKQNIRQKLSAIERQERVIPDTVGRKGQEPSEEGQGYEKYAVFISLPAHQGNKKENIQKHRRGKADLIGLPANSDLALIRSACSYS